MKMKKAEDAQSEKANRMRHPDFERYSGWIPETPTAPVAKVGRKMKQIAEAIVAPLDDKPADDGDSN